MEALTQFVTAVNDLVWGPPMLIAILGTGLYLQFRLKFMPISKIVAGFRMVWKGRKPSADAPGEITPYAALMTALCGGAFALPGGRDPARPKNTCQGREGGVRPGALAVRSEVRAAPLHWCQGSSPGWAETSGAGSVASAPAAQ